LRHAARRGVDVRVLVPGRASDHPGVRYAGRRYYQQLLKAGVRIYEYRPRFLHAKLLLGDDRVSIGSSNFDRWNLRWNLEANLECVDPALAGAARRFFEEGFATADEIRLPEWRARGLRARCTEWFFGVVERFLDRER
jgi:phosphatidylserine/phosphatidylglycerophosphate/cardiolipin synthase-like enzyme